MAAKRKNTSPISGGGEMGERIRSFDWSKTCLGAIDTWPQSLVTSVNIILQSPIPLVMLWGKDGIMIYNDAYSVFAGQRHPRLLGSKIVEGWPEVADFNQNVMKQVLRGKTLSYKDQQLTLYRNNVPEEVWMILNYSPIIDESGKPAGVLAIVVETSQRVLAEQKQKKAEEDLQAERDRFRTLIEQSTDAIQLVSPEGKIIYTSESIKNVLGFTPEELQGQEATPYLHPEDTTYFYQKIQELLKEPQKPITMQYRVRHKDGSWVWLETTGVNHLNTPNINALVGTFRNITKRKQVEEALKQSEDRFRTLIEQSSDVIQLVDADLRILYTSDSVVNIIGFKPEEIQGLVVKPYVHPDDVNHFLKEWKKLLKKPLNKTTFQYRVMHKDGSWIWLETAATNHLYTPNINAIVANFRDITERKNIEEALRQAQNRYQKLFNSNLMGIYISDFKGTIREANDVFLSMVGYSKKDLKEGKIRWDTMTLPEYKQLDIEKDKELRATGQATPWEKVYKRKDGTELPVLVGALITEESSNACMMFAVDISERKKLERQKDDFLGIASHELKTPVTSVKAYAQALESRFRRKGDTQSAALLAKMDSQVNKLTNLINDLLDSTKIEAGKLRFTEDYFDFNGLVNEVVEEIQRTTDTHTIIKELTQTQTVYGDRDRLGQVITNYLTNAIKYSPSSYKIIVKTQHTHKNEITLSVQDFGVGVPSNNRNQIFERFYRVTGKRKETYPGLGLGLYISSEIIKRHGGKVWVESSKGKGSTFYFSLPLKKIQKKS